MTDSILILGESYCGYTERAIRIASAKKKDSDKPSISEFQYFSEMSNGEVYRKKLSEKYESNTIPFIFLKTRENDLIYLGGCDDLIKIVNSND